MQPNPVKAAVNNGGVSIGTFLFEFNTPGIVRIVAEAGADFVLCDMEHSGWSFETIRRLTASAPETIVPIVRVPAGDYNFVARALDMGARGVMVPMVGSAEHARRIVNAAKYPPLGRRGCAFTMPHDGYTGGSMQEKIESANRETLIIVQIETREGLEQVDKIAAVEGVDVLWIGQTDLTASLGIAGQFDSPEFFKAVDAVAAACERHGKTAGYMPLSHDETKDFRDRGFRMLACGGDLWIFKSALRKEITAAREL
ncbi:MAG: aldolase [Planctomycetota bacterium]|nr:MAG: aldolase [Planctomycetota bacterium]REJ96072.1 MAG: aldolase [Planctomycetota bacterium]REK31087.1 MAG: aldolase [Planctomycetota bacterium]REK36925.1 MAG: aldolase [Planctomycetota bacterium]